MLAARAAAVGGTIPSLYAKTTSHRAGQYVSRRIVIVVRQGKSNVSCWNERAGAVMEANACNPELNTRNSANVRVTCNNIDVDCDWLTQQLQQQINRIAL